MQDFSPRLPCENAVAYHIFPIAYRSLSFVVSTFHVFPNSVVSVANMFLVSFAYRLLL